MWVKSLVWEDPLEEGVATHFSILAWRIPIDRVGWLATVHRSHSRTRLERLNPHARTHGLILT